MTKGKSKWDKWVPFIEQQAGKMTRAEIAEAIGTTCNNLAQICHKYGIKLPNESHLRPRKPGKWERHLPFIREHANKMRAADIAAEIGTTTKNVYNICHRNGISITYDPCEHDGYAILRAQRGLDPFCGTVPRKGGDYGRR